MHAMVYMGPNNKHDNIYTNIQWYIYRPGGHLVKMLDIYSFSIYIYEYILNAHAYNSSVVVAAAALFFIVFLLFFA